MGSIELTVTAAKDLKNVNWRNGPLKPYVVVWVEANNKCSTRVDKEGDAFPVWDENLTIPLPPGPAEETVLYVDVVHAGSDSDTKPLVGSAKLKLRDVIDEVGYGGRAKRSLQLKRSSGRPQGKVDVKIEVREPPRYRAADPYYAPPPSYGGQTRDVQPPQQYGYPYSSQTRDSYYSNAAATPPAGYPSPYGAPVAAPPPAYGQPGYGNVQGPGSYGQPSYGNVQGPGSYGQPGFGNMQGSGSFGQQGYGNMQGSGSYGHPSYGDSQGSYGQPASDKKKSKFGMGTGLAVGAVAGVLGGLALGEGIDYVENKIADDVAEKVENDFYNDDDY